MKQSQLDTIIEEARVAEQSRNHNEERIHEELTNAVSLASCYLYQFGFPMVTRSWDASKDRCIVTGVSQALSGQLVAPVVVRIDWAERKVVTEIEQENMLTVRVLDKADLYRYLEQGCRKSAAFLAEHESAVKRSQRKDEA